MSTSNGACSPTAALSQFVEMQGLAPGPSSSQTPLRKIRCPLTGQPEAHSHSFRSAQLFTTGISKGTCPLKQEELLQEE